MSDEQREERPAAADGLPRPEMWPAGAGETPFTGIEDDEDGDRSGSLAPAWVAVGLMVVGVVLVGLAFVLQSWVPAVVGVVVGVTGLVLALRARIFEDVKLTD